jgi:DNA-directed RNA polymerase subunit L
MSDYEYSETSITTYSSDSSDSSNSSDSSTRENEPRSKKNKLRTSKSSNGGTYARNSSRLGGVKTGIKSRIQMSRVKVRDVDVGKNILSGADSDCKRVKKLLEEVDSKELDMLMPRTYHEVSFNFTGGSAAFANAIRRCIISDIEVYSLNINYDDFYSDDRYLLNDYIIKQFEMIPIQQDSLNTNEFDKVRLSINKFNSSENMYQITPRDLKCDTKHSIKDIIGQSNYVICRLRPGFRLKIENINIVKGTGSENYSKFSAISNITYRIMNFKPRVETKFHTEGTSILRSCPRDFYISYETHGNYKNPRKILSDVKQSLSNRLQNIMEDFNDVDNNTDQFFSENIEIEKQNQLHIITIKNEYRTIADLLQRYIYEEDPTIKFITSTIDHPDSNISIVKIRHTQYKNIICNAIKTILQDISKIPE